MAAKTEIHEDVWISTRCGRCYNCCALRVHRVNGVAVKVEGNPESKQGSQGGVCAKGAAGLQVLYDPNRLNVPLRRTNPEKGLHADPKWKEITWEEALDEITARMKKVLADDPGKNRKRWLGLYSGTGKITLELARLVSNARESIYANTPYLVLSKPAIELFRELRTRSPGIDIRIATNSLAATDSWFTYAASFRQKRVYVQDLGFRIYEMKPLPGDMRAYMPTYDLLRARPLTHSERERLEGRADRIASEGETQVLQEPPMPGEPYFCLHAKSFVIDDEMAFIGSYNLDPRSENLNTEVGLIVRDRSFAALVKRSIMRDMEPRNAWVVAKNPFPAVVGELNAVLEELSRLLPLVDPWPVRSASLYELKEGRVPVDPGDRAFYECYRAVGSFPHVTAGRGDKIIGVWTMKTLFSTAQPLL